MTVTPLQDHLVRSIRRGTKWVSDASRKDKFSQCAHLGVSFILLRNPLKLKRTVKIEAYGKKKKTARFFVETWVVGERSSVLRSFFPFTDKIKKSKLIEVK